MTLVPRPASLVERPGTLALRMADVDAPWSVDGPVRVRLDPAGRGVESYALRVGREGVDVVAGGPAGILHARTTLRQLLPPGAAAAGTDDPRGTRPWQVPCVQIDDAPRFPWRGLMLDTCRHFFPVPFVKRFIDAMALHKLNVFHWHLTDDQGWRIEIRRHPALTATGAWRAGTAVGPVREGREPPNDGVPHGGFYTRAEVREVVSHAAERGVTVVPEIEMPGHARAALAAYPRLSCTGRPLEVARTWGIFEDVFCAGNEGVFTLLEEVIDEVAGLFPGQYVHVGGDECPKNRWKACPECQAVMRRERLPDEAALQSWFVRRVAGVVNARGKRLIGWDEILEGGLPPGAAVMSWRGAQGGIEAARAGHDVVMAPCTHCYLDYRQAEDASREPLAQDGYLPLEKVHGWDPVPQELGPGEGRHIAGVQANLWTEYVPTGGHAEYMTWPRACALAEVAWSPAEGRTWSDFRARLPAHLSRLGAAGYRFRPPD